MLTREYASFLYFLSVRFRVSLIRSRSPTVEFNNMSLFDDSNMNKNHRWGEYAKKREKRLVSPVENRFGPQTPEFLFSAVLFNENLPKGCVPRGRSMGCVKRCIPLSSLLLKRQKLSHCRKRGASKRQDKWKSRLDRPFVIQKWRDWGERRRTSWSAGTCIQARVSVQILHSQRQAGWTTMCHHSTYWVFISASFRGQPWKWMARW